VSSADLATCGDGDGARRAAAVDVDLPVRVGLAAKVRQGVTYWLGSARKLRKQPLEQK
jgi:hypothetical protein